ncbi:GFA family protein [Acinetobacter qingfengensis]|uniref:Aldehyde-activating protein n=1 Tax=Acinetobacter qingfengensis TaxID=1262585 RepID=A0A1E7RAA5_9GAMM|nr:GFA family protein [Acinetobacter qingfengensis]KAA8733918.1 GFA family protein [Acinetobacter qingfengensis]OEY96163.1 aldehyde-activating protein [Acinetobacter qingfengensis]
MEYVGSCLCSAVRYKIEGDIGEILQCHCQRCRKTTGSAFAVVAPVHRAQFKFLQGESCIKKFQSTAITQRWFCSECGSPIVSLREDMPEYFRLRVGTLDTILSQRPAKHIFVASKAEWECIYDDLPQYAERPE